MNTNEQTFVKVTDRNTAKQVYRDDMQRELSELEALHIKLGEYINTAKATLQGEVSFLAIDRHDSLVEETKGLKGTLASLRRIMTERAKFLLKGRQ